MNWLRLQLLGQTEPAMWRGWPAPLMSSGRTAPDLPLYFATPATRTTRLRNALAASAALRWVGCRWAATNLRSERCEMLIRDGDGGAGCDVAICQPVARRGFLPRHGVRIKKAGWVHDGAK